jgi:glyoxylase-like metal-dependent hydrolase (beta-lactamase superfamily II)
MQLTSDIYRVDAIRGVNVYLILAEDGVTLVDTGFPGNADKILAQLAELGREPGDIRTIVLTHGDNDHIGNVAALKAVSGATVAIGAGDAPALQGGAYERATGLSRVIFGAITGLMRTNPVDPDILLVDGDTIAGLHVHETPGHTVGSIALERDDGVVFSGDTLLGNAQGEPTQPTKALAHTYDQALASAAAVEALDYTLLLPGHGEPVRMERTGS